MLGNSGKYTMSQKYKAKNEFILSSRSVPPARRELNDYYSNAENHTIVNKTTYVANT